jgi:DNA-binding LacI/PurR family transcriptional regulator
MEMEGEKMIDKVEWGVVTKIFLKDTNIVYVIYGPAFCETAHRVAESLRAEGYSVVLLNEGNDYDASVAEKLRALALQHDC